MSEDMLVFGGIVIGLLIAVGAVMVWRHSQKGPSSTGGQTGERPSNKPEIKK